MPNWCECDLKVVGKKDELERFRQHSITSTHTTKNVLDTNKFIPYPREWLELDKKDSSVSFNLREKDKKPKFNGCDNGYDWCNKMWGTKWGICDARLLSKTSRSLSYEFRSAWAPPLPVVFKMSELFPKLKFALKYYEMGCGFKGTFVCEDGEIIGNEESKYKGSRGG